jgi:SAM-dependent methyltransferase
LTTTKRAKFFLRGIKDILNSKLRGGDFEYYNDEYWNDLPAVQNYINKCATDNPDTTWIEDILTRFTERIPFEKVLIVGCGNGWVERQLYDLGIGKKFDAFDISPEHIDLAKKLADGRKINYFLDDMNNLENIPSNDYDVIFNVGVLHHVFRLSKTIWILHKSMKKDGLMFNFEYIGSPQNQYSDEHLKILERVNEEIGSRFSSIIPLRPKKSNFETGDPTEAVNADLVRPTLSRFFDTVHERNINGGVAYQILWNNIEEFKKTDEAAKNAVKLLITKDQELTENGKVPILFWYSVLTPKSQNEISNNEFLPS